MLVLFIFEVLVFTLGFTLASKQCCQWLGHNGTNLDNMALLQCVNQSAIWNQMDVTNSSSKRVLFASFVSKEIVHYASKTLLINSLYYQRASADHILLSEDTGDNYDDVDKRWNKIKAIGLGMDTWARNYESIAFVDSDLAILDFDLRIESLLDLYPAADLILSEDSIDVANSGFMVIRRTSWAKQFFEDWWNLKTSKNTFCDQHVFNNLYNSLKQQKMNWKVSIIPSKVINSLWPVVETFDENDQVLHLMGETPSSRDVILTYTANQACHDLVEFTVDHGSFGGSLRKTRQLGLNRESLQSLVRHSLLSEYEHSIQELRNKLHPSIEDFEKAHDSTVNLCNDKRPYVTPQRSECLEMFTRLINLLEDRIRTCGDGNDGANNCRVAALDQRVKSMYNRLYFVNDHRKIAESLLVKQALDELALHLKMDVPSNQRYIQHKHGLLMGAMSLFAQNMGDWQFAKQSSQEAIESLGSLLSVMDQNDADFSGYSIEYLDTVTKYARILFVLREFSEAREWATIALHNAKTHFDNFGSEDRIIAKEMGQLYLDLAGYSIAMRDFQSAKGYIQEFNHIHFVHNCKPSNVLDNRRLTLLQKLTDQS